MHLVKPSCTDIHATPATIIYIHAAHMNVARRNSHQLHASHDIHYIYTEMICFHCQVFVNFVSLSRSVGLKKRSALKNPPTSLRQCSGSSLASACYTKYFFRMFPESPPRLLWRRSSSGRYGVEGDRREDSRALCGLNFGQE